MKHLPIVLAACLLAYTFLPTPETPPPATGPVAQTLRSAPSADREFVASIYRSLADVVWRDAGQRLTTAAIWRAVHRDTLALAVGSGPIKGKYPGLDTAVEETLAKYYTLQDTAMTPELVAKIIAACEDVEGQCRN